MLFDRFKKVKAFVFGAEGVLCGADIQVAETGVRSCSFNVKDAYALRLALKQEYPIAVAATGDTAGIGSQMAALGMVGVYLLAGDDKTASLDDWLSANELNLTDILYMGSDIPDLDRMNQAGFPACPADAAEEIKAASAYISRGKGGGGAVRDVVEKVMKLQGKWWHTGAGPGNGQHE